MREVHIRYYRTVGIEYNLENRRANWNVTGGKCITEEKTKNMKTSHGGRLPQLSTLRF